MNETLITFNDLTIGYREPVLSNIDFEIKKGQFCALLGANGSGKSTLIKTLLGLQKPLSGKIKFKQGNATEPAFAYVPQSTTHDSLFLLTAFEVAQMGCLGRVGAGRFIPKKENEFVHECLRITAAEGFADQRFFELSGGQKQRVLMARALATKTELLILDEPTAGVDPQTTKSLFEFLSKLHREKGCTILLVTHDLPLVKSFAEHVIWIHEGKILTGPANELLSPQHLAKIFEQEVF